MNETKRVEGLASFLSTPTGSDWIAISRRRMDARNDRSGRTAGDVLEAARDAFTTAVDAVAAIGAVLFVLLAILAAVALRKIHPRRDVTPSYSGT